MERPGIEVREETAASLDEYATVSIAFEVASIFDVAPRDDAPGGFVLTERRLAAPYVKDYDATPGERPTEWARHFDLANWGVLTARVDGRRAGGAALAFDTPGVGLLEGRRDLAVLWDMRVAPEARGHGVGAALLRAAESWACARGCRRLRIETQQVNVPACRFYARMGYALAAVNRGMYAGLPDELQLIWEKRLAPG